MLKKIGAALKTVFGSLDLTQTTVLQILGNAATAVGALVPSESSNTQIIIVALGGVVSNLYPLISAVHKAIEAIEAAVKTSTPAFASLAAPVLSESLLSVDEAKIKAIVEDLLDKAESTASLLPTEVKQLEVLVDAEVKKVIADLLGKSVAPLPAAPNVSVPSAVVPAGAVNLGDPGGQQA